MPEENSNEYACLKVKLKAPAPRMIDGEIRYWSEIVPGSGPQKRCESAEICRRCQKSVVVPDMVQGGTLASTFSLDAAISSAFPRVSKLANRGPATASPGSLYWTWMPSTWIP